MAAWLEPREVDILCLQEVRAPDAVVSDVQERLVKSLAARNAITARVVDRLKLDA